MQNAVNWELLGRGAGTWIFDGERVIFGPKREEGVGVLSFGENTLENEGWSAKTGGCLFCGKSGPSGSKREAGGSNSMFGNNSRVKVAWVRGSDVGIFGNTWDISWSTGEGGGRFFLSWRKYGGQGDLVKKNWPGYLCG